MNAKSFLKSDSCFIFLLAATKLIIHLYTNAFAGYGIFRDEFYYIACTKRPDMGYVDQPPFSIYILAISRFLFGETQFALRLLPAITSAVIVFLTGMLTKKLGGGRFAIFLACVCVIFAPILLGMPGIFSMNVFDHLFWILSAYIIVLLVKEKKPEYWIYLGLVLGLGLLNKIGVMWLCAGVFVGIILTPLRSSLKTRYPYITAGIAFVLFLPFIIWNITHDFAHLEFIRNATQIKYSSLTRTNFVIEQFIILLPFTAFVWIPGLYYFLFHKEGKTFRILGIIYVVSFLILLINGRSKGEYLAAAYPILMAGGGVFWGKVISARSSKMLIKFALPLLIIAGGILTAPLAIPVLPVETYIKYAKTLGMGPSTAELKELSELPQFYADMFGWEEMAKTVSRVYLSLPDEEKKNTVVFALNYGEAGALEYYSNKYPLPKVVCPHNNFWYWGEKEINPQQVGTTLVTGGKPDDHKKSFDEVLPADTVFSRYAMPYENNLKIYICRKIKRPFNEIWKSTRFFI